MASVMLPVSMWTERDPDILQEREEQIRVKVFGYKKELNLLVNINRHCGQSRKTYA